MRIVALSDQHGHLPEIPACDLLIVAGDVCPDLIGSSFAQHHPARQKAWFDQHVRPWLEKTPAAHKILTWGNHDWCGQACSFEHDAPAAASTRALQIVVDEATRVPADGTAGRSIGIWGSPWSNLFMDWAFMKPADDLAELYGAIPRGIDILISHQPPYGYGDRQAAAESGQREHLGSRELLATIERVRPRFVICGHIHGGHGCFRHDGIAIYNVSIVDDEYRLARTPTVIDVEDW